MIEVSFGGDPLLSSGPVAVLIAHSILTWVSIFVSLEEVGAFAWLEVVEELADAPPETGARLGYYTAILAELVASSGRVTAVELDPAFAARAASNFAQAAQVRVVAGDGTRTAFDPADVIYVNAGATRRADC
jgi:predicted RNA methylase